MSTLIHLTVIQDTSLLYKTLHQVQKVSTLEGFYCTIMHVYMYLVHVNVHVRRGKFCRDDETKWKRERVQGPSHLVILAESGDLCVQVHLDHKLLQGVGQDSEGHVVPGHLALVVGDCQGEVVGPVDQV